MSTEFPDPSRGVERGCPFRDCRERIQSELCGRIGTICQRRAEKHCSAGAAFARPCARIIRNPHCRSGGCQRQKPDAILAFGLIFDGETLHASLIATAVTQALLTISLKECVPVLHEIIVAKNEEQAKARCLSIEINRGTEAARAAVRIVLALRHILKEG